MSGSDRPRLHFSLLDEDDGVCLRVQDAGSGVPEECLPRIFDPFFTTKGVPQRAGLGLSVCFSIYAHSLFFEKRRRKRRK